jgi:hypothetical protein
MPAVARLQTPPIPHQPSLSSGAAPASQATQGPPQRLLTLTEILAQHGFNLTEPKADTAKAASPTPSSASSPMAPPPPLSTTARAPDPSQHPPSLAEILARYRVSPLSGFLNASYPAVFPAHISNPPTPTVRPVSSPAPSQPLQNIDWNFWLGRPPVSGTLAAGGSKPPASSQFVSKISAVSPGRAAKAVNHLAEGGEQICVYFSTTYPSVTSQLQGPIAGLAFLSATAEFYATLNKEGATIVEKVLKGLLAGASAADAADTIFGGNLGPGVKLAGLAFRVVDDVYEAAFGD